MSKRNRTYTTVTDEAELQDWLDVIEKQGYCAFDTETTGLDAQRVGLVGLVFATSPFEACYIPLTHVTEDSQLPLPTVIRMCKPVLENPRIVKVMQNAKYDMHIMRRYGVTLMNIQDVMLLSFSQRSGVHRHGMDELAMRYMNHRPIKFSEVTGRGENQVTFDYVPIQIATEYAAEDGAVTLELLGHLRRQREDWAERIYNDIEMPLLPILADMEQNGVLIDPEYFKSLAARFEAEARDALARCIEAAGCDFNPGSSKQLAYVLYEKLGLPIEERTDSGAPATGVKVLEGFEDHERATDEARAVIKGVLDYRGARKLQTTYCEALQERINPATGRVHPSLLQHGAQTGRLACRDPNLQNVPVRTDAGKLIRKGFIASPGYKLIAADYSQIELRILAHVADETSMKAAFERDEDIHAAMAAQIHRRPIEDVSADERRDAKRASFGIAYGSSPAGIAYTNDIPIEQAEAIVSGYFASFPGIAEYMKRAKQFAREHGYVESHYGRRLWLPRINAPFSGHRRHAERQAVNGPIQGTAADIMKFALIDVAAMLINEGWQTKMLLTVHDEILFEAPEHEVACILPRIVSTMEQAYELSVPLKVEAKSGDNWLEAH